MHLFRHLAVFTLAACTLPGVASAQGPITAGETKRGVFVSGQTRAADDSYYDDWTFRGSAGQRVVITMRSDAFDAYLNLGRGTGGAFQSLTSNDDKPGTRTTDAEIDFVLPAAGEYTIRANSLTAEQTGAYTVSLWMSGSGPTVTQSGSGGTRSTSSYLNPVFSELMGFLDREGGTFTFMIVGKMTERDTRGTLTLNVVSGKTYVVRGACDSDCSDLDLTVVDANGKSIGSDAAIDDHPMVTFTARATEALKVTSTMASCKTQFCFYGVVAMSR